MTVHPLYYNFRVKHTLNELKEELQDPDDEWDASVKDESAKYVKLCNSMATTGRLMEGETTLEGSSAQTNLDDQHRRVRRSITVCNSRNDYSCPTDHLEGLHTKLTDITLDCLDAPPSRDQSIVLSAIKNKIDGVIKRYKPFLDDALPETKASLQQHGNLKDMYEKYRNSACKINGPSVNFMIWPDPYRLETLRGEASSKFMTNFSHAFQRKLQALSRVPHGETIVEDLKSISGLVSYVGNSTVDKVSEYLEEHGPGDDPEEDDASRTIAMTESFHKMNTENGSQTVDTPIV
jgi:hypothetical protein